MLVALTGKAYGSLGKILPVMTGEPWPVVTDLVFRSVHRPSVVSGERHQADSNC